ncbi:MAG: pentapeptide repeat-containing protein [Microcoleus anatoxicus]|uniref:pentapeptide repeat-containing protein n=1 Tax=Microcoleus anatoxicus TaxID=2705319 RepID=UPI00366E2779
MPAILPDMRSLHHNKYPDCLWMQLEAVPIQKSATELQHLNLYLSINFNEHWQPLLGGRVKFGLQGGTLKLNLKNCEIPLASRQLVGDLNLDAAVETQPIQNSIEILVAENLPEIRDDQNPNKIAQQIDETDGTSCHVSTIGDDTSPAWVFELERGKPVLKGLLTSAKLGEITATNYRIDATFEVTKEDIHITDAEGLWPHDITPNQHSVLERILTVHLQANQLQPALSWALLCCDSSAVEKGEEAFFSQSSAELQEMVDRIISAKTDDFAELAKIANLNPAQDFAGANLRGTTLSAVDFSSANLDRANFRGADLSDADFSDANLQNAKFSGADLSGAFLGNADLKGADLHKASLALANLGGANLCNANLVEVNLTNANLSGANVESARFGNNSGISEEMQVNLQQRGAIFEEV